MSRQVCSREELVRLREQQMSYLRHHHADPGVMKNHTSIYQVSERTYYRHKKLAAGPPEDAVFQGGQYHEHPESLIREKVIKAHREASENYISLSSTDLYAAVSMKVAAIDPNKNVTLDNVHKVARRANIFLRMPSKVLKAHDPETNRRRNSMAHDACAAVQQAITNRVLVAAMDEASFQVGPVVGTKKVYATTHGLTFDNLPANVRSLKVNLMTFVTREGSMASFTYLNNTNKAVFEENLRAFLERLRITRDPPDVLLLFDNARYHSNEVLFRVRSDYPFFRWARLPVYSPDTNPTEFVFHVLKSDIRHHRTRGWDMTQNQWNDLVRETRWSLAVSWIPWIVWRTSRFHSSWVMLGLTSVWRRMSALRKWKINSVGLNLTPHARLLCVL